MLRVLILMVCVASAFFLVCPCPRANATNEQFPWGLERVHSDCVWDNDHNKTVESKDYSRAGAGVKIAVIDGPLWFYGVYPYDVTYHVDLADNLDPSRHTAFADDFNNQTATRVNPTEDSYDSHGTKCAGIIGAVDNDIEVIGNAPKVDIYYIEMVYRSIIECAYAINWAVDEWGVDVISISYEFNASYPVLEQACEHAFESGVFVAAITGNKGAGVKYPGNYSTVVAVGAVDQNDDVPSFSNHGENIDFVAPGVDIYSTTLRNGYDIDDGTSFACPHVAAAAALVKGSPTEAAYGNVWNATTIYQKLNDTALDLNATGVDEYTGWGLVNAWRANQRPQGSINNDYYTNAKDAVKLGLAFGSTPNTTKWNRNVDINIDNYINAKEAVIIGKYFGQGSGRITQGRSLAIYGSKLKVQPSSSTFYADTTTVGDNFSVSIITENVSDLYGWELGLHWTSGLIDCVNETVNYAVWSDYLGPWVTPPVDNENGTYHQGLTARDPASSFNGTTWLANLTFQIMQAPPEGGSLSTPLTITTESGLDYCLLNSSATEIPHDFVHGSYTFASARHMRGDTCSVNGLETYKLNTTQSTQSRVVNVTETESNTVYWGIRVWKRSSAGTETEITGGSPVAVVSRSYSSYGLQSAMWNCLGANLTQTDSIVIRAYCMNGCPWTLIATFTTPQLNATAISQSTWTVYYWTQRTFQAGGLGKTTAYFKWGTTAYNSRIHNFTT